MTEEERKLALHCLKASSDYHSEVCEECVNYPNCDHTIQDDVTETIIKALEQEPCEDAISRQEVLDILKDKWNKFSDANDAMQESIDAIKALKPVTPKTGRWIPVSERLPEKNGRYLAYIINPFDDKLCYIMTCEYFTSEGWCPDDECSSDNVVAWMSLPESYKGEEGC